MGLFNHPIATLDSYGLPWPCFNRAGQLFDLFCADHLGYGHVVDQGWLQADEALAVMGSTLCCLHFSGLFVNGSFQNLILIEHGPVEVDGFPGDLRVRNPKLNEVMRL